MSTRAGGSPGLINRSMCNFSLTFTVVDCQFEHCIGKTIQRVKVWTVCEGFFFWGGGWKFHIHKIQTKICIFEILILCKNHYTSLKTTLCNQGAYIKYMNYTKTSGDARYRLSQNKANVLNLKWTNHSCNAHLFLNGGWTEKEHGDDLVLTTFWSIQIWILVNREAINSYPNT